MAHEDPSWLAHNGVPGYHLTVSMISMSFCVTCSLSAILLVVLLQESFYPSGAPPYLSSLK